MKKMRYLRAAAAVAAAAVALSLTACNPSTPGGGDDDVKTIGFITKFPVDFFDIMVDAVKAWDEAEPGAEVIFAQGESGTDDEGLIAAIQSFVTQGVDAIAITPTSPALADELQKAVDAGIPVILNTSFNENEPIVCQPSEAIECFMRTKMDILVIGSFFCKKDD